MPPERTEALNYLERARLLMEVGRWREALHELHQHIFAHPDSYHAYCQAAVCHYRLRELQVSFDLTKKAVELSPEQEWAYRLQSLIFGENGETKRALDSALAAAEKAPYFHPTISCLFWAQMAAGFFDEAEKTLGLLQELEPDAAETYEAAGYLALQRDENLEAERLYLQALKIDPESVNALNNLGVVYLNLAKSGKGHHYQKKSVKMFESAVRQQPTFKPGQANILQASNAFKFGAPAGVGISIWFGFQIFGRVMSWLFSPQGTSFSLTPITSSVILTTANVFFLLVLAASFVYGLGLFVPKYKDTLRYHLLIGKTWPIAFACFGSLLLVYVFGLLQPPNEDLGMSGGGFGISLVLTLIAGLNTFRLRKIKNGML